MVAGFPRFTPDVHYIDFDFYSDGFNTGHFTLSKYVDVSSLVFPTDVHGTSKSTLVAFYREFQMSSISCPDHTGGLESLLPYTLTFWYLLRYQNLVKPYFEGVPSLYYTFETVLYHTLKVNSGR